MTVDKSVDIDFVNGLNRFHGELCYPSHESLMKLIRTLFLPIAVGIENARISQPHSNCSSNSPHYERTEHWFLMVTFYFPFIFFRLIQIDVVLSKLLVIFIDYL